MTEPTPAQPQVLQPAQPVPPPAGKGFLRGFVSAFLVLGALGALIAAGLLFYTGGLFSGTSYSAEEVFHSGSRGSSQKIAIVTLDTPIIESTAEYVLEQLKRAREDEDVKGIVFKVDTPGGTINASDHIHRKVRQLCRGAKPKPVVVSMQGIAASGGYYVSAPADKIFAEPTTITGSIGVIASFPVISGLMEDFKVKMEVIKTGPLKDAGSPFRDMTPNERERWQEIIGESFQRFVEIVAEGRGLERERVMEVATGEVFTAKEALQNKLVDEIGYIEDAIAAAEKLAGLKDARVVEYRRPPTLSSLLFGVKAPRQPAGWDWNTLLQNRMPQVLFLSRTPEVLF